ncbi:hypothetical protein ABW20_dc0102268 [Dactylellina cionopaga]|nr:hypothetical protein ABW20_dc0102268 [Dactylellina cionopaga]
MARIEFEDNVLGWLNEIKRDNAKLAERLSGDNEVALKGLILPELHEIKDKLDNLQADVSEVKGDVKAVRTGFEEFKTDFKELAQEVIDFKGESKTEKTEREIRERFQNIYKDLRPSDIHIELFYTTLNPLKQRGTRHISRWLFDHEFYRAWETGTHRMLYIQGQPGFGKSVTMAVAVERLLEATSEEHSAERYQMLHKVQDPKSTANQVELRTAIQYSMTNCPVLFFFFKMGDDNTQLTRNALRSLTAQLFNTKHARSQEEMKKFIAVLDIANALSTGTKGENINMQTTRSQFQKIGHQEESTKEGSPKLPGATADVDLLRLELLAEALGRTVYILVDGIDECTDYQTSDLVTKLIKLGRSTKASFRILLSSRENSDLEKLFIVSSPTEQRASLDESRDTANLSGRGTDENHLRCLAEGDTAIMTVTKSTNEHDMRAYLGDSLTELLNPATQLPRRRRTNSGVSIRQKNVSKKQAKEILRMVDTIREKAEGMFTYSAMVIASLSQPSSLSIKQRIRQLPDQMDSLYARYLDSLTTAQRKLVMLALERVIYAPTEMNILEIIEQFKEEYLETNEGEGVQNIEGSDDEDGASIGEVEDSDDEEDIANTEYERTVDNFEAPTTHLMEKEAQNPDILYTIYHLQTAGREFFKFTDGRVDVIHKSVRDWVEKEAKKASERYSRQLPIAEIFQWGDFGEIKVTVPKLFVDGVSTDFKSERDAKLDVVIYQLELLTNQKFLDKYLPLWMYDLVCADIAKRNPTPKEDGVGDESGVSPKATEISDAESKEPEKSTTHIDTLPEKTLTPRSRGELFHWCRHLEELPKLWPRETRTGRKWDKLKTLFRKLSNPEIFKRWCSYLYMCAPDDRVRFLNSESLSYPCFSIVQNQLTELYLEFLIDDESLAYDFNAAAKICGSTILHRLKAIEYPDLVERLIVEKKVDLSFRAPNGQMPFIYQLRQVASKDLEIRQKAIKSFKTNLRLGPKIQLKDMVTDEAHAITAIYNVIGSGDMDLFDAMMERRSPLPDFDLPNPDGHTVLHWMWATMGDDTSIEVQYGFAKKLLEMGIDPNGQDINSGAPLTYACMCYKMECVELLLEWGADVNDDDITGFTALIYIAGQPWNHYLETERTNPRHHQKNAISIIKILRNAGADLNIRNKHGITALMNAIGWGYFEVAEVLFEMHASEQDDFSFLTQKDINENNLLHRAVVGVSTTQAVEFAVSHLDPKIVVEFLDEPGSQSYTALALAVWYESHDMIEYLIRCYSRFETQSETGSLRRSFYKSFIRMDITRSAIEPTLEKFKSEPGKDTYRLLTSILLQICLVSLSTSWRFDIMHMLSSHRINLFETDTENWDGFDWAYTYGELEILMDYFPEQSMGIDYASRLLTWQERFEPITGWDSRYMSKVIQLSEDNISTTIDPVHEQKDQGEAIQAFYLSRIF